jgi:hypothetical protein
MCAKAPPDDPLLFGAGRRPVRRRRWTVRVETAERRNSEDDQDLALITVRRDQLASVSQELAINVRIPTLSASGDFRRIGRALVMSNSLLTSAWD